MVPAQPEGEVVKYLHRLREEVIHNSNLRSLPNGTDITDKMGVEGTSVSFDSAGGEDLQISTVDNSEIHLVPTGEVPKGSKAEGVDLTALLVEACQDVDGIAAATFRSLLSADDVTDILAGDIPAVPTLRAFAESFAGGIRAGRIKVLAAAIPKAMLTSCVRCADCVHFDLDTIGDGAGIGRCKIGGEGTGLGHPALWPNAERACQDFTASAETSFNNVTGNFINRNS